METETLNNEQQQATQQEPQGTQALDRSWLPEEYRDNSAFKGFTDASALCKSYLNQQNLISKRVEDYTKDESEAFLKMRNNVLDIPEEAGGYEIDTTPIREGSENQLTDNELDFLKTICFENGLSRQDAQKTYDLFNDYISKEKAVQNEQVENYAVNNGYQLAQMWGENNIERCIADVDTGISVAEKINGYEDGQLRKELETVMSTYCLPCLTNMFRTFAQLGGQGYGHGLSAGKTPQDASNELDMLRNSAEFKQAMRNPTSPEAKRMIERVGALSRQITGEQ